MEKFGIHLYKNVVQLSTQTTFETVKIVDMEYNKDRELVLVEDSGNQHKIADMPLVDAENLAFYLANPDKE